jgi:hypothetical protein
MNFLKVYLYNGMVILKDLHLSLKLHRQTLQQIFHLIKFFKVVFFEFKNSIALINMEGVSNS